MKYRIGAIVLAGALLGAAAPMDAAVAQGHGGGYGHGYGHDYGRGYSHGYGGRGFGPIGAIVGVAAALVTAPFIIAGAIAQSVTPPPVYYPSGGSYYAAPAAPAYGGGYYQRSAPNGYAPQAYGPPPGYGQQQGYAQQPSGYGYGVPPDYVPPPAPGYGGPRN